MTATATPLRQTARWARITMLPLVAIAAIVLEAWGTHVSFVGDPIVVRIAALFALGLAPVVVALLPGLAAVVLLDRRLSTPAQRIGTVLVGAGVTGLLTFWCYYLSSGLGELIAVGVLAASTIALATPRAWDAVTHPDIALPLGLAMATALFFSGVAYLDGGIAQGAVAMFQRVWTVLDNIVPSLFAEHLVDGKAVHGFIIADWHFSDRPPLQTAMLLPQYPLFANRTTGYQFGAIALQSLWPLSVWALLRSLRVSIGRAALVVLIVVPSGALFFNSVYVWPKLLAGAIVVVAFAVIIDRDTDRGAVRPVLVAALALLAMLSHGSSIYPLLALAPFAFVLVYRRCRWSAGLVFALVAAILLLYVPWSAFQHFEDPPGNRLMKWHLADVYQLDDSRSTMTAVLDRYAETPFGDIVVNKLENFGTLVWRPDYAKVAADPEWTDSLPGKVRIQQIELLVPASMPLLLMALALITRRGRRAARGLAGTTAWTAISLALWCLLQFGGPTFSRTVLHNGSLAPLIVILALSALLAARLSTRLAALALAAQLGTFAYFWVFTLQSHPALPDAPNLGTFEPAAAAAAIAGLAALAALVTVARVIDRRTATSSPGARAGTEIEPAR